MLRMESLHPAQVEVCISTCRTLKDGGGEHQPKEGGGGLGGFGKMLGGILKVPEELLGGIAGLL